MRALFLNHNVVGTGTYQRASNFGRELAQLGHDVTLITTSRTRRLRAEEHTQGSLRIIEAPDLLSGPARTGWDVWNTMWRTRRLALEEFDVVHAFDCRPAVLLPALQQRRRGGATLFFDWADWWGRGGTIEERSGPVVRTLFGPIETWFEESFRTQAIANTTISEALRQRCVALGVPAERVLLLPEGCAPPMAPVARASARRALGLGDEPWLVHVGVTQPADAELLMNALRLLRTQVAGVRLVLIGNFRVPTPADLTDVVHRTGYLSKAEMHLWLAAADAGVVPLRDTIASRGRWPGKVSEYLTAGLPTVLPAVGDAARIIAAAGAGRVCAPNAAAFAEAMAEVLSDAARRAELSANARGLAAGKLSWHALTQRLLAFYARWTNGCGMVQAVEEGVA